MGGPKPQSLKRKAQRLMVDDPSRLEREVRIHKRLQELLLHFSRGVSTNLGLAAALERLAPEIRDLAGARSVEIWLHDRRKSQLYQAATSEGRTSEARVSMRSSRVAISISPQI